MNLKMNLIKTPDKPLAVEFDREFQYVILESLRYEYGRHTISTGDTARWISYYEVLDKFDIDILEIIRNDIDEFERLRSATEPGGMEIYDHDVVPFLALRNLINIVLSKKGYGVNAGLGVVRDISSSTTDNMAANPNSHKGDN